MNARRLNPGILRAPRRAALATIALLVAAASLVSFAESYRGLYLWAHEHHLYGTWAAVWPLQVDTFIAVGELALFVALVDAWNFRSRIGAWIVTGIGLVVSVAGNVGHVAGDSLTVRGTAAVPPVAAAAALAVGLGVLKRVVEHHPVASSRPVSVPVPSDSVEAAKVSYAATLAAGNPLSRNQLMDRFGLRRPEASELIASFTPDVGGDTSAATAVPAHLNGNGPHGQE